MIGVILSWPTRLLPRSVLYSANWWDNGSMHPLQYQCYRSIVIHRCQSQWIRIRSDPHPFWSPRSGKSFNVR